MTYLKAGNLYRFERIGICYACEYLITGKFQRLFTICVSGLFVYTFDVVKHYSITYEVMCISCYGLRPNDLKKKTQQGG